GDLRAGWDGPALLTVLYLGLVPTALGFYLWNRGAARTGSGRLAVANNLKVPLAVLVSWWIFGETADYARVLAGLAVVTGALFLAGRGEAGPAAGDAG
ncbi:MAG TPA: EamA family transporter, partial [Candidatus Krumholzibacteria bacterium]|nr:EamA family transporter [Candidatus Krumholzibacteria bacterium]